MDVGGRTVGGELSERVLEDASCSSWVAERGVRVVGEVRGETSEAQTSNRPVDVLHRSRGGEGSTGSGVLR